MVSNKNITVNTIWRFISSFWGDTKITSEYLVQGKSTSMTGWVATQHLPVEFKATMYQLNKQKCNVIHVKQLSSNQTRRTQSKGITKFSYGLNSKSIIKMPNDIYVKQLNSTVTSNDSKQITENHDLYIYSHTLKLADLTNIITRWTKEYDTYIKNYNDGNI